jgi:drug/metabolite transporter (DMT)-like permease
VVVCAWLVLGQRPSLLTVVGGVLIAGAGVSVVAGGPVVTSPEVPLNASG